MLQQIAVPWKTIRKELIRVLLISKKMEIKELNKRPNIEQTKKLTNRYVYFENLINELKKREIPSEVAKSINKNIEDINSFYGSNKDLLKQIRKSQSYI